MLLLHVPEYHTAMRVEDRGVALFALIFFAIFTFWYIQQKIQYRQSIEALQKLSSWHITKFRIYPKVINPVGYSVEFYHQDPIIDEFLQAFSNIYSYRPTHDRVESRVHNWFVEISTKDIQRGIHFRIPAEKGNIVAGNIDGLGWFQSQQLFQWYQKYSHRWLEPEKAQTAPAPQP